MGRRMDIRPETDHDKSPAQPLGVLAAFVAVTWIGIAASVLPLRALERSELVALGVTVGLCTFLFLLALRKRGQPSVLHVIAPLAFLPVVATTREIVGGPGGGTVSLLLVPVLWIALTGTPRQLVVAGVCTVLTIVLPILFVGPPRYPAGEWRRVAVTAAIITLIVPLVQRLVRRMSYERERAESTLVQLDGIMRGTAGTLMVSCDLDGTVHFFNVGAEELLGRRRDEVVGTMSIVDLHDPDELAALVEETGAPGPVEALAALAHSGTSRTLTYVRADGSRVLVRLTMTVLEDEGGQETGYLAVAQDTTQEVEAARALEQANNHFRRLFTDAPHGVAVLDTTGRIMLVNRALRSILGLSSAAALGQSFADLVPPGDTSVREHLDAVLQADGASVGTDCVLRSQRGLDVHVALSSRVIGQDHGPSDTIFVNVVDVSERLRYQEQLSHLVDHDVLTGLANRRRFDTELTRRLAGYRLHRRDGALLLLDLDHFKQVNDTLGHNAGDRMLVEVAKLLTGAVRGSDVVGRLGGDEFVILLTEGDERGVERVASVVVEQVRQYTATLEGAGRRVTASVGGLSFRSAADHTADVLALADMTMYESKDGGRDQAVVLAEGDLRPLQLSVRMEWEERIEQALATDGFELHLQPIMEVATGEIGSAEVLLRMRTEDGLQPPGAFLPIAERTGLMTKIDAWVARHSVPLLARLQQVHPGFRLQVNLSGYSIGNPEIERTIREALARNCVGRGALIFEVTETAAVADVAVAREFAERLVDLGCAFALDDYGAGYGSLHYLKHLLFDYVKIDGEFVADSHHSEVDRTILRSIAGVARGLGKRTIAEFVEDPAVLEVLREEGVDQAQGYLVGRPVPVEEFMEIHLRPGAGTGGVTE